MSCNKNSKTYTSPIWSTVVFQYKYSDCDIKDYEFDALRSQDKIFGMTGLKGNSVVVTVDQFTGVVSKIAVEGFDVKDDVSRSNANDWGGR